MPKPKSKPSRRRLRKEALDLLARTHSLAAVDAVNDFPWASGLSYQQLIYIIAYSGNNPEACEKIGVPVDLGELWQNNEKMQYALQQRLLHGVAPELVAGKEEREAYWTQTMRSSNESVPIAAKLKCSEYLARTAGDFIDRSIIQGDSDNPLQIFLRTGVPRPEDNPKDIIPQAQAAAKKIDRDLEA